MKIKVNDKVKILAGKDKGKEGTVIKTLAKENKVIVEGINMVKRHQKPRNTNESGGIFDLAAPIHVSNVKKLEGAKKSAKKETPKKEVKEAKTKTASKTTKTKKESKES